MEIFYIGLFSTLALVAVLLNFRSGTEEHNPTSTLPNDELRRFKAFRFNYLVVFCLMMCKTWRTEAAEGHATACTALTLLCGLIGRQ
jgi:hypothetical protein